jgi:hypothetical protein
MGRQLATSAQRLSYSADSGSALTQEKILGEKKILA